MKGARMARAVSIGCTIPDELLLGAGFEVWQPAGAGTPSGRGDEFMETSFPTPTRVIFDELLTGRYDDAAVVVFDRSQRDLFYYAKEIKRLGLTPGLPPLHLFDLFQNWDTPTLAHNERQYAALWAARERGRAPPPTPDDLVAGVERANRRRRAVRAVQGARAGGLAGSIAFDVLTQARYLSPEAHEAAIDAVLAAPRSPGAPAVVLLASQWLTSAWLHRAVEAAGGNGTTMRTGRDG
jgi:hypothetical protein